MTGTTPNGWTGGKNAFGEFAPVMVHYTDQVLFDEVWEREVLSKRDRSLVTVAALTAMGAPAPGFMAKAMPDGTLVVAAVAPAPVPSGRNMELWILPPGADRPASLGMLPASGYRTTMARMPADGTQLMISLEPPGGSPTGAPTGPVVYAGKLVAS